MRPRKVRAHYSVHQVTQDAVWIIDLDDGAMSVTNDADAVVAEVVATYGDKRIIYRDSEGRWDELAHDAGVFRDFVLLRGVLTPPPGIEG